MPPRDPLASPARPLNLTTEYLDRNLAAGRAEHTALIVDSEAGAAEEHSYADVAQATNRLGRHLIHLGIGMEDRVLIVLPDGASWVHAFFATLKIGAVAVFVNPDIDDDALRFYLTDSRAKALVTDHRWAGRVPDSPSLRATVFADDAGTQAQLAALDPNLDAAPTTEEDFAIWLYSSGSTGAPKAAVHRAMDFVFNTERYAKDVLQMSAEDRTLSVPKLFFGYATGTNLLFPFYFGATAILFPDKPTPPRLFELIARHKPTVLVNVPAMMAKMSDHWERSGARDCSSLRVVTSAGEALPEELYHRWRRGPGCEVLDGIGSAEMFHVFISQRLEEVVPGSLGRLVDGYEARIVRDDGGDCDAGEIGTLWIRGQSAAAFYWQRAETSRRVLHGDWVITGDKFERSAEGLFYYRGRADELMKVNGRWVSPQEIESALTEHDDVLEAVAAPYEQEGLTKPIAYVVLKNGAPGSETLAETLKAHVAGALAPFKAPRVLTFVSALPRGDRGKIDRKQVALWATDPSRIPVVEGGPTP